MEKIAILIPVRNGASSIRKAISSVYSQTLFKSGKYDFQIILIDNNSTDDLKTAIKDYDKITYLFCEIPGVVPARNTGVHHILSNKEYNIIANIDCDDEWFEDKLEKQINYLIKYDVCGTGMRFSKDNNKYDVIYPQTNEQILESIKIGNNPFGNSSVILKTNVFKLCGGYDSTYKYCEDFDLFLRASQYFKMYNLPEVLVNYNYDNKNQKYLQEQAMFCNLIYLRTLTLINK